MPFLKETGELKPGPAQNRLYIFISVLIFFIAMTFLGLSAASIFRNRNSYISESHIKSKAQAQLMGENTSGIIYTVDFALLSICSLIKSQTDQHRFPPSIWEHIKTETKYLPQVRDVFFLDEKGETAYSTGELKKPRPASFEEHRTAWLEFSIETVFSGRDNAVILLSRRVENRNGDFIGVLVAGIDSKFFYDRYDHYLNIDANAIVLFDNKGIVLTGWFNPSELRDNPVGSHIQSIPRFSSLSGKEIISGGFKSHESRDEIISAYQIWGLPYHIAVMHTKQNILRKWKQETKRDIVIIGITFIIALCTIILGFRQRRRREKAEFQLLQYQLNLEDTVEKRTEQLNLTNTALVKKNEDLEKALAKVKTLSGLLPICSHCKKIRDDKGYWNQIESYIQKHSEAEFSHGICRECAKKYYPEFHLYKD
jgi:hypothetical protein